MHYYCSLMHVAVHTTAVQLTSHHTALRTLALNITNNYNTSDTSGDSCGESPD
jgi:hypothetical protein